MKGKMQEVKLASLIEDMRLYPRTEVSSTHVSQLVAALRAGAVFPPIRVDSNSMRIIDGLHRYSAYKRLKVETLKVQMEQVPDDATFFELAIQANSFHGRPFVPFDYKLMLIRAEEFGLERIRLAVATQRKVEYFDQLDNLMATSKGEAVPIKQMIQHMRGRELTEQQIAVNKHLGGPNQFFLVNQLLELLRADLIDDNNQMLMIRLAELDTALRAFLSKRALDTVAS